MFHPLLLYAIFLFTCYVSADFFIANTTACYGDFFVGSCNDNVQVISSGISFSDDFTCDKLHAHQTSQYIKTNTAGPDASSFTSTDDVCGAGQLYFQRNNTSDAVNGTFNIFKGTDASGDSVGTCEYSGSNVTESKRRCSQLFGTIFFEAAYRCNTTVCGYVAADYSSSSSSAATSSTATASTTSTTSVTTTTSTDSSTSTTASSTTTSTDSSTSKSFSSETSSTSTATTTSENSTTTTEATTTSTTDEASSTGVAKRTAMGKRWIG